MKQYRQQLEQQERLAQQRVSLLQRQKRLAHHRFQERYLARLREQQVRLRDTNDYDYDRDPYFSTAPDYRYYRSGKSYETNEYGADSLREAVNHGYEEGFRAGQADREDGWEADYRNSYAYQDASYGYNGYYVDQDEYRYYFREGFRRGYEDGYNSRSQYGSYANGQYNILGAIVSQILNLQPIY